MKALSKARKLSDTELLEALEQLHRSGNETLAALLEHLGEVDARKLYLRQGFSSTFVYCVQRLNLSNDEAYRRITAARASRRHPQLLPMVARGELHLTGITLPAPHLEHPDAGARLQAAAHGTRRKIEELVATWAPREVEPRQRVRKLPARPRFNSDAQRANAQPVAPLLAAMQTAVDAQRAAPPASPAFTSTPHELTPAPSAGAPQANAATPAQATQVSPQRYQVQLVIDARVRAKLDQARELLRRDVPDGDLARLFERALDTLIEHQMRKRLGSSAKKRPSTERGAASAVEAHSETTARKAIPAPTQDEPAGGEAREGPRGRSRHIPLRVRRAVWERDQGCCTYVSDDGRCCDARSWLEFHHEEAFGRGGGHSVDNVRLLCRGHNELLAADEYGVGYMQRRRSAAQRTEAPLDLVAPPRTGRRSPSARADGAG